MLLILIFEQNHIIDAERTVSDTHLCLLLVVLRVTHCQWTKFSGREWVRGLVLRRLFFVSLCQVQLLMLWRSNRVIWILFLRWSLLKQWGSWISIILLVRYTSWRWGHRLCKILVLIEGFVVLMDLIQFSPNFCCVRSPGLSCLVYICIGYKRVPSEVFCHFMPRVVN
jgi:hypothetical protein